VTLSDKSTQRIAQESVESLENYLAALKSEGKGLPSRNGRVSVSAIALAVGTDRQTLYKNSNCRGLLERATQELGLQGISARALANSPEDLKDRRIQQLESENASMRAEVEGLRKQLRRYEHLQAHLIETGGRRVIP